MERRRLIAAAGGTLLFSLAPWQIAEGAKLVNVRMWPAEEYTRVTIETDVPLKFKHFMLRSGSPIRLVIDIEGLALTERVKRLIADVKPDDPYIGAMRIGQFKPGVLRLVMDLKTDVKPEVFLLKPFANYKYRLVFDVYPAHPRDAIGRILSGSEDTSDAGDLINSGAAADPLGDVLAGLTTPSSGGAKPQTGSSLPAKTAPSKPAQTAKSFAKKSDDDTVVIVIDPGHGGEDPGAIGRRRTQEKTVVLQIARRLVALIGKEPGMKAVMTRNSDHFVSLGGRVAIARRVRAHLLVSIHADAWVKSTARGSSVFALSQKGATSAAARWLAKSQNESDLIGGVNITTVNKQVASVLVDMTSSWTISYSLGLGSAVLQELADVNKLHKGRVEQAGFAVLKGQGIPSILVETAFISNPTEEQLLKNASHQQKLAQAILTGIKKQLAADKTLTRQG
ncbi:N-acetylmuramoyl-L-alanine amidase [uncultured Sutterella sp.]|uniref:N-acetylmuramoyl-L-alanine amidase n=1 Tax=uncultured Sutterella sp. TaxID=286133 RepID=UPI0025EF3822|nr:N-acetylmuramoyl-L-alanine amidase [uncultured Sutterella sp.]